MKRIKSGIISHTFDSKKDHAIKRIIPHFSKLSFLNILNSEWLNDWYDICYSFILFNMTIPLINKIIEPM